MDEQKIGDNYIVEEDKTNEEDIYQKNKVKNQEKMRFFKFLMYNTKVEIHLEELQSYLLWVSILENVVWLVCLALFISSPSTMKINWTFIYHVARAGVGIMLLFYIPKTFQVIENLQDFESNSLDDIQKGMETNYVSLLQQNEKVLKPLLMIYFILTVISVIIDIILFIVLCNNWSTTNYEYRNFVLLIAIVIFIGIYNIIIFSRRFCLFIFL